MNDQDPIQDQKNKKRTTKRIVPQSEIELAQVAERASENWSQNKWLRLQWKKASVFRTEVARFQKALHAKRTAKAGRPQITLALKTLDKKIEESLNHVKGYLAEAYGKEASQNYYPAFGMLWRNNFYSFPVDQNGRLKALKMMVAALPAHNLQHRKYGLPFWQDCLDHYERLLHKAVSTDGTISKKVGEKKLLKKEIKKTLNSLILSIKANQPDNFKGTLRQWGFQKEKY